MTFELIILGSNSAIPAFNRYPTAQVLNINEQLFLIDCGEGTQMQLQKYRIRKSKINHIFISHLHGDHFFGLIGLITSFHLMRRDKPLHIYGPALLQDIVHLQLKGSRTTLSYELVFHTIRGDHSARVFDHPDLTVETIIMNHRIPCTGFLFKEKPRPRKILAEKIEDHKIPVEFIKDIKNGADYHDPSGVTIKNHELTNPPPPPRSYAFCSDTAYNEAIIPQVSGVDLLYHEATFGDESAERARETLHSTAREAATIAAKAQVKQLLIGHFSAKYKELEPLLEEAQSVFPQTALAIEGESFTVPDNKLSEYS